MKEILLLTLFIALVFYKTAKNKNIVKELNRLQLLGIGASYTAAIFLGFVCIYYGGNWIAGFISNGIIQTIVKILIVCFALVLCGSVISFLLKRLTNGVLPKS